LQAKQSTYEIVFHTQSNRTTHFAVFVCATIPTGPIYVKCWFQTNCYFEANLLMLQASLPETTHLCTENKLAERPSNRRQPEQR